MANKTFPPNETTKRIRARFAMKAWNSRFSKWESGAWLDEAIRWMEKDAEFRHEAMVAYAILNSRARGILDGTYEMALRALTGWQMSAIVGKFCEECRTHDDVILALRKYRGEIIAL